MVSKKQPMLKDQNDNGYSILELSISLSIIALLIVGSLSVIAKKNEADRRRITYNHLMVVQSAIYRFQKANQFIPCPALPALLESNTNFGRSDVIYNAANRTCSNSGLTDETGAIPVKTLGINDKYSYDGWNRKFTYRTASGSGASDAYGLSSYVGNIKIIDLNGNENTSTVHLPDYQIGADYVIISYGPNGKDAAWKKNNATAPIGAVEREAENTTHTSNVYIQNDAEEDFDDIVVFSIKEDIELLVLTPSPIKVDQLSCNNASLILSDGEPDFFSPNNDLATYGALFGEYANHANVIYEGSDLLIKLCETALDPVVCSAGLTYHLDGVNPLGDCVCDYQESVTYDITAGGTLFAVCQAL